jgi:TonB-linked SusC/RagA family outer membrane protein
MYGVVMACSLYAQQRTITGKVTSGDDGSTLPGVNILVKGTTNGTVTDANGTYSLSAPSSAAILTFSFIGLATVDVPIGDRTVVDVAMTSDITQLSEVVVTSVGIQRESRTLGYSVATIKSDALNQGRVTNIAAGLSGKVAGLQINQTDNGVNSAPRIVLRGNRSFLGDNQALIVVDGVQVSSTYLNSLNPNDTESITVLKGSNAAALYGSQAANGVLVINTKLGKKNSTPEITFSTTTQIEQVAFLPKLQTRFGLNGGEGPGADVFNLDPNFPGQYVAYENQSYGPEFNGQIVQLGRPVKINGKDTTLYTTYSAKYDDHLKFWNTGVTTQNDISFSTSTDKSSFFVSFQDVAKKGVVPSDQLRKDVFRFNGSTEHGIVKIGYRINYTLTNSDVNYTPNGALALANGFPNIGSQGPINNGSVYNDWINTGMNVPLTQLKDWRSDKSFGSFNTYFNDFTNNPYWDIDNNRRATSQSDFLGTVELSIKPTSWLTLVSRVGLMNQSLQEDSRSGARIFDPAVVNHSKSQFVNGNIPAGIAQASTTNRRINADFLATVSKNITNDFSVTGIVGGNIFDDVNNGIYVATPTLLFLSPIVYNPASRTGNLLGGSATNIVRRQSVFADLTLSYKYLTVHGSFRNDWTSLLATNNQSFNYPEVDASFIFTEAIPALQNNKIISYGKLTASIGKTGSVNLNPYSLSNPFTTGVPFSGSAGNVANIAQGTSAISGNLAPEFTLAKEIGLEFGLFKNRIIVKPSYYETNTTNQTVSFGVSASTGYNRALINTGEMLNRGFELETTVTAITTSSGFKWNIAANYTDLITNTPLSIYTSPTGDVLNQINIVSNTGAASNTFAIVGEQYGVLKVTDWVRDPEGRVVVDGVTGLPSRDPNIKNLGQTNPKYRLGITNSFTYKSWSLNVLMDYRSGNQIFNAVGATIEFGGIGYNSAQAGRQRFVYPNSVIKQADGSYTPNTNVTVNDGNYNFWQSTYNNVASNYVVSAAFWKLREINLGYELPKSLLDKTKFIKSARVSVSGRNLFMWRPESNQWTDPEFSTDNSNANGTTNGLQTPPTRQYGITLAFTF